MNNRLNTYPFLKYLYSALLIMLSVSVASSQNYLSVNAGILYSDYDIDEQGYESINISTGSGFFFGGEYLNIPENGKTPGIKISAFYSQRGATVENNGVLHDSQFNAIDFDLLSHIYIKARRSFVYLDLGPGFSVLTKKDVTDLLVDEDSNPLQMNSTLLSVVAGLGYDRVIGSNIVGIFMRFKFALTNLYSEYASPSNQFDIGLTYRLPMGR